MITLIRPPHIIPTVTFSAHSGVPPLGMAYLAGALHEAGIQFTVIDSIGEGLSSLSYSEKLDAHILGLTFEEIIERIPENSKYIMLSLMFSNEWFAHSELIQMIKFKFPNSIIVVGGESVTSDWKFLLENYPEIAICILGEGEQTVVEISKDEIPLDKILGIAFRNNNEVIKNNRRPNISPLNLIAIPAWQYFPLEEYLKRKLGDGFFNKRIIPMLASRGCPYQCTFCSSPQMWTTNYQLREVSEVLNEMQLWVNKYNIEHVQFYDLTAIVSREWIENFASELIDRKMPITWSLPSGTRIEALTKHNIDLLYRSGCRYMSLSPESGSEATLRKMKKNLSIKRFKIVIRELHKKGITTKANLMFGLPEEKNSEIIASFVFMLKMLLWGLDDLVCINFVPYPGSKLHTDFVLSGKIDKTDRKKYSDFLKKMVNNSFTMIPNKKVRLIVIIFPAVFYSLSFILRPHRFYNLIINVLTMRPRTLLEKIALDMFHKIKKKF